MDSESPYFSFLPFSSLVQDISPDAQSIGIITQPFGNDNKSNNSRSNATTSQVRWFDARNTTQDRCRTVVHALVDYIQVRHPRSRITIHNGPHETIALAYARMVMANQSIAGISTFGVFPVLSTFGTGYLHQPHGVPSVTSWLFAKHGNRSISQVVPNLHVIYDRQYMMVSDMKKLWQTSGSAGVLAWFTSDWKRV
jgi:hypothetical protein